MLNSYLALAAAASVAHLPQQVENEQPALFRCTGAEGDYTPHALQGAARSLSARISFAGARAHSKWAPAAGLLFVLPGKRQFAGVQAYVMFDRPDELVIGLKLPTSDGRPLALSRMPVGRPVDVRAALDEAGNLTVAAGTKSRTVRIRNATVLGGMLMCSSGAFTFENLSAPLEG